ncbi:vWA domain-containing protein [Planosporangium mesophilum]
MLRFPVGAWQRAGASAVLVDDGGLVATKAIARVDSQGRIRASQAYRLDEHEWTWVLAHCLLHLGFGHLASDRYAPDAAYASVACLAVTRFQRAVKLGTEPLLAPSELPSADEAVLLRQWREAGVPAQLANCGAGGNASDLVATEGHLVGPVGLSLPDWPAQFALGLAAAATAAVDVAGGARTSLTDSASRRQPWDRAMSWFLSSYPLLGALASRFTLVADADYDRLAKDIRRLRKLATLRGTGLGDVLGESLPWTGSPGRGVNLDDFYRRALLDGYTYHEHEGRGHLPAGLVAEIRVLQQPPLPWDAQLARWFDEHVPSPQRARSYARPSRRQASTPGIPRPGWYWPPEPVTRCTFGVVLDTSGSMNHELLGKALGAIASYSAARDVPAARVVFCDAYPYDAGYLPVEEISGRVRVRGRGGTLLQPGINLLERAPDFPPTAPILVITDGYCDVVRVRREHAFLVPLAARLPFTPRGPVFRLR